MKKEKFISELSAFAPKLIESAKKENVLFSQGGWTGWANIKLAKFLLKQGEITLEIEKNIYGKKSANLVAGNLVVEMKCQSKYAPNDIITKIDNDLNKLKDLDDKYEKVVLFFLVSDCDKTMAAINQKFPTATCVCQADGYLIGYCY